MAARTPARSLKPGRPDEVPWGDRRACSLSIVKIPPQKHLLLPGATRRGSAKALSPQTDVTEAAKSLGGKSRAGFIEKLVPVLWGGEVGGGRMGS